ncbi:MAG: hypothetical protein GWN11_05095 [Candidatus Dadabacteria bacterium]|nr:hypothetical protein [Candidatus Dadabacteria bacterium]NIX15252.1 hypothetical protein [Candidatus Dadabacteria bacterium]
MYLFYPLPEFWPFSPYPMFSGKIIQKRVSNIEITGVMADGREIPLDISEYFYPFNRTKLRTSIMRSAWSGRDRKNKHNKLGELQNYLLNQYDVTKKADYHNGPSIVDLRIYRKIWDWSENLPQEAKSNTFSIYPPAKTKSPGAKLHGDK